MRLPFLVIALIGRRLGERESGLARPGHRPFRRLPPGDVFLVDGIRHRPPDLRDLRALFAFPEAVDLQQVNEVAPVGASCSTESSSDRPSRIAASAASSASTEGLGSPGGIVGIATSCVGCQPSSRYCLAVRRSES